MALVNNGNKRSMVLWITKNGTDNTSTILKPTTSVQHEVLDGKKAFGGFAEITDSQMQELSDIDFQSRVDAWKINIQSAYSATDPDMWNDISGFFKYSRIQIVRVVEVGLLSPINILATIHPYVAVENIQVNVEDPFNNHRYTLTIPVGSSSSDIVAFDAGSTSNIQSIDNPLLTYIQSPNPGAFMGYDVFVESDVSLHYPIQQ